VAPVVDQIASSLAPFGDMATEIAQVNEAIRTSPGALDEQAREELTSKLDSVVSLMQSSVQELRSLSESLSMSASVIQAHGVALSQSPISGSCGSFVVPMLCTSCGSTASCSTTLTTPKHVSTPSSRSERHHRRVRARELARVSGSDEEGTDEQAMCEEGLAPARSINSSGSLVQEGDERKHDTESSHIVTSPSESNSLTPSSATCTSTHLSTTSTPTAATTTTATAPANQPQNEAPKEEAGEEEKKEEKKEDAEAIPPTPVLSTASSAVSSSKTSPHKQIRHGITPSLFLALDADDMTKLSFSASEDCEGHPPSLPLSRQSSVSVRSNASNATNISNISADSCPPDSTADSSDEWSLCGVPPESVAGLAEMTSSKPSPEEEDKLAQLRKLGFTDRTFNRVLLWSNEGDLEKVISSLENYYQVQSGRSKHKKNEYE